MPTCHSRQELPTVEADIEFVIRKPRWMNKWVRDKLSQCARRSLPPLLPLPLCSIFLYHSPPSTPPPRFLVYQSTPNGRWVRGSLETKMIKEILDLWLGGRWGARHHSLLLLWFLTQQVLSWLFCDPMDYNPPGSLSMGFARQEYWNGLPFPSPGDLSDPGMEPTSPALAGGFFSIEPPGKSPSQPLHGVYFH